MFYLLFNDQISKFSAQLKDPLKEQNIHQQPAET